MAALRSGVDLGGTNISAILVSESGEVAASAKADTPRDGGPSDLAEAIAAAVSQACAESGCEASELAGVGVGWPGAVDDATGMVAEAPNLAKMNAPFALAKELERRIGAPVRLGNDVSVATRAEFELGAGREFDSLLGVYWGTGVGGGIIVEGELLEGRGAAGEFGHTVIRRRGALCGCGNRGCVEAYAGRRQMEGWAARRQKDGKHTALFEIAKTRGKERLTSSVWAHAYRDGDQVAIRALERAADALGTGIASAHNLLDVPAVVIGGGMGERFWESHGPRIAAAMHEHLFQRDRPPLLLPAGLGDLGGALGAALLVEG